MIDNAQGLPYAQNTTDIHHSDLIEGFTEKETRALWREPTNSHKRETKHGKKQKIFCAFPPYLPYISGILCSGINLVPWMLDSFDKKTNPERPLTRPNKRRRGNRGVKGRAIPNRPCLKTSDRTPPHIPVIPSKHLPFVFPETLTTRA
jgi:hypothetical protein